LEHHRLTSISWSAISCSSLEWPMVDIRVRVDDTSRVPDLMQRLAKLFNRSSLSFDGGTKEIRIASEWESRTVVVVIEAVHSWVAENDACATLSIGDRSYTAGASAPVAIR
jgi:benzoyl-CoA reductase/2-hydroxyglutaryl-CoA dehydratase subunit BcrC/BadD/HgdB